MASGKASILPPGRGRRRRDRDELAFLPAALEIVETPPSPIGRTIGATIIALFCLALAWAAWGRIDIVASAPGKIVPSGRTKTVQPFEIGVVRAIRVQDGQSVKAGDVLVELDTTLNQADRERLQNDLVAAQLEIARLRAALAPTDDPLGAFAPPIGASPQLVAVQRQFLLDQAGEQRAKLAALDRQEAQRHAQRDTIAATIAKLEATIPLLQQRVDIRRTLVEHETGSKLTYLEILQDLVEHQHELAIEQSRYREAEAALAATVESRAQTVAEYRRTLYGELTQAEAKAAGTAQDLVKAQEKTRLQSLAAPVDGVVQQLAVHTVGGVVTPAQVLLAVVPADSPLEIEAMVSNRDIGFVHAGQEAEIKVETFNFTRYGLLHGRVLGVSPDAVTRDKPQDKPGGPESGAASPTSEAAGREPVYAARIALDRMQMRVDGALVNLSPGMAVTAEIKTGDRTVLSYLLSPLLRFRQDSFRER